MPNQISSQPPAGYVYSASQGRIVGLSDNTGKQTLFVQAETNELTGGITKIAKLTQAQYDALVTKDDSTLYVIVV